LTVLSAQNKAVLHSLKTAAGPGVFRGPLLFSAYFNFLLLCGKFYTPVFGTAGCRGVFSYRIRAAQCFGCQAVAFNAAVHQILSHCLGAPV
jgi:hypothetical protein